MSREQIVTVVLTKSRLALRVFPDNSWETKIHWLASVNIEPADNSLLWEHGPGVPHTPPRI